MGILLSDGEIESITAKALGDNPHWQPDAWGLFNVVAKAQLKKVGETFDYDVCSMAERFPTAKELTDFINKWQALLKEIE